MNEYIKQRDTSGVPIFVHILLTGGLLQGVLAAIATAFEFISLLVESWYHESHDSYSTAKEGLLG